MAAVIRGFDAYQMFSILEFLVEDAFINSKLLVLFGILVFFLLLLELIPGPAYGEWIKKPSREFMHKP